MSVRRAPPRRTGADGVRRRRPGPVRWYGHGHDARHGYGRGDGNARHGDGSRPMGSARSWSLDEPGTARAVRAAPATTTSRRARHVKQQRGKPVVQRRHVRRAPAPQPVSKPVRPAPQPDDRQQFRDAGRPAGAGRSAADHRAGRRRPRPQPCQPATPSTPAVDAERRRQRAAGAAHARNPAAQLHDQAASQGRHRDPAGLLHAGAAVIKQGDDLAGEHAAVTARRPAAAQQQAPAQLARNR